MLKITTLMDNLPSENKALCNEHGLSVLVEYGTARVLFDCGAGRRVWGNAEQMGKDVTHLDGVILSHSHYDHAAGYRSLVEMGTEAKVLYTGDHFFEPKYAVNGMKYTDLSAGFDRNFLEEHGIEQRICRDVLEISTGLWLIGDFERSYDFETIAERFVKETPEGMRADLFEDEICLAAETSKGLVLLVGCSHPGILNMVETVYHRLNRRIYAVFGGTHLVEADEERVCRTVELLKNMGLEVLGLSHCSGQQAEQIIQRDHGVQSCHMAVGDSILID